MKMWNERYVSLIPISERAKGIFSKNGKEYYLKEYECGVPLNKCPDGSQGIYCISRDRSWEGWFSLDRDVRFKDEKYK